jgi:hypothetical protein
VLLALAAIILGGVAWWTRGPAEPMYQGQRLSQWLYENSRGQSQFSSGSPMAVFTGARFEATDTDAIVWLGYAVEHGQLPRYDRQITAQSSRMARVRAWMRKWLHLRFDDAYDEGLQAAVFLSAMRADAAPAIPSLLRALGDNDIRRSERAWMVLARIGPPVQPAARQALVRGSKSIRRRIARELPYVPWYSGRAVMDPERMENLKAALTACGDSDAEVRGWAGVIVAECCLSWGYDPAMEPAIHVLISGLSDSDAQHRICAASYLPLFGAEARAAFPRLGELLRDAAPKVRLEAVRALYRIGGKDRDLESRFRQMLNDPDPDVADAIKSYLGRFTEQAGN